jgi:hypothetical protein
MIAWLKSDDVVVTQLAIGGHVDHILVRRAAEMLKRKLVYDVDIPYLLRYPEELTPKTANMKESLQPVSETGLKSWLDAIEAYITQFSSLFDSHDSMREMVRAYWFERKGIGFWTI